MTTFRKLDSTSIFREKRGEENTGLKVAQAGGPTERFCVLFLLFYLNTETESSFRNIAFYNLGS
jgi:hypothetical protein